MYYLNNYLFLFNIVICKYLYFRCTSGTPVCMCPRCKGVVILNKHIYIYCQYLATDRWFSPGPPVSCTNKIDRHNITELLYCWKLR